MSKIDSENQTGDGGVRENRLDLDSVFTFDIPSDSSEASKLKFFKGKKGSSGKMEGGSSEVTFLFQFGLVRDSATVDTSLLTLKTLKEEACRFIMDKVSKNTNIQTYNHKVFISHNIHSQCIYVRMMEGKT